MSLLSIEDMLEALEKEFQEAEGSYPLEERVGRVNNESDGERTEDTERLDDSDLSRPPVMASSFVDEDNSLLDDFQPPESSIVPALGLSLPWISQSFLLSSVTRIRGKIVSSMLSWTRLVGAKVGLPKLHVVSCSAKK
jgi:hypothetical protein